MKNLVFDLGAVLLQWNPAAIIKSFTSNSALQQQLQKELFLHPDWLEMDRGLLSEVEALTRASDRIAVDQEDLAKLFSIIKESLTIIPETVRLLELASDRGFDLYCLSNMSPENYRYLKQKYAFFDYFKGIVVSGLENTLKPEAKIYKILLQRYSLEPGETLFIDDREENTNAAVELGISTITFSATPECYSKIQYYIES